MRRRYNPISVLISKENPSRIDRYIKGVVGKLMMLRGRGKRGCTMRV